jgi:hypothetical protein
MGITDGGFFRNGQHLENQIGKKFDINKSRGDTEVFKNQNSVSKRNMNLDIVKRIIRIKPVIMQTPKRTNTHSLFRNSTGFKVRR